MRSLDLNVEQDILDPSLRHTAIAEDKFSNRVKLIIDQQDDCKSKLLDLQFHSQASISSSILDLIFDFNALLKHQTTKWQDFIEQKNRRSSSTKDLIIF